ncbi:hypothetical protein [Rhodopseudomonas telluris]|uniref:Secreted protein n=1 Tax=Rhodopseudomonas telluris TaxID=644215 RepID=A0ABV6EMN9_9BRAD
MAGLVPAIRVFLIVATSGRDDAARSAAPASDPRDRTRAPASRLAQKTSSRGLLIPTLVRTVRRSRSRGNVRLVVGRYQFVLFLTALPADVVRSAAMSDSKHLRTFHLDADYPHEIARFFELRCDWHGRCKTGISKARHRWLSDQAKRNVRI